MCLQYKSFENTVGKEEIAHNGQFLLFPLCFLPFGELSTIFLKFEIVSCKLFSLEDSKICCLGKGLTLQHNADLNLRNKILEKQ